MADDWVPSSCSLPTAELPLRVADFDRLFAEGLAGQQRVSATALRLWFSGGAAMTARVRELAARETQCCSFFEFTVSPQRAGTVVDIRVPADHVDVLDALAARARRGGRVTAGPGLRRGQVAEAAGVNVQTLRYYERRGLLHEPQRSLGGHRLYPSETVTLLRVIKAAKRLGFTLDEVGTLLEVGQHRHRAGSAAGLQARAQRKLAEIDARLADLTAMRDMLQATLAAGCEDLITCAEQECCPLPFSDGPAPAEIAP